MWSSLASLVPILFAYVALSSPVEVEKRDNVTLQAPIVATPSQHWEGIDGSWSTFEIRVGSAQQVARVLPATSWQEVWVVFNLSQVNCNTTAGVSSNCAESRGGFFSLAQSSTTWKDEGFFDLGLNNDLGYGGQGDYGFDTVGLGYTNTTGITLPHQVIAMIESDSYWFGMLGLGFQPSNFSDYGNPQASFSDTLASNATISSMTWSYTAGASYRSKGGIYGSLIFGGYDASRFTPNDVVFTMTGDNLRDIVLGVRSITSTTSSGNTTLMSDAELVFIDSTVPELWLPVSVCQAFEKAFGLSLDPVTDRYLLNASTHANLTAMNPNITLTLGNQLSGGPTIDIVLPYSAFDLNVTAPIYPSGTSYYFPLRQAQNDSMYTLGRTFLQEAYVTADYNSRTFNVSQCVFVDNAAAHVLAIPASQPTSSNGTASGSGSSSGSGTGTSTTNPTGSSGSSKLSGGAIAGIVVGVIAVLVIAAFLVFFCCPIAACRRRRRRRSKESTGRSTPVHEIDSGKRVDPNTTAYSAQASAITSEVPGHDAKVEIAGNPIMHPQELEADVPMLPTQNIIDQRVSGPSQSSGETSETTAVSSLSKDSSPRSPMAELHGTGRRPFNGPATRGMAGDDIVSPQTPTAPTGFHRGGPEIVVSSPADSNGSNGTWSPRTPQHSRFEERWSHPGIQE